MLTNTKQSLEDFRKYVSSQARRNLTRLKKNDTKGLYKRLDGVLKVSPNSFQLSWDLGYGNFQDKGVSGTEKKYDTPYSYKSKMPPIKPLSDWAKRKGIRLRDEQGKFQKGNYKTIGFLIARSIFRKGIKPSLFFTKPFEQGFKNLPDQVIEAYGLDVEEFLKFTLNKK
ncbi:MAG: hypothetical protein CMJ25_26445 [Phycisphaerae bacterium]|jgi:hypothetical protein|nr:hypothetical protein [Phycisphaerae bacterium]